MIKPLLFKFIDLIQTLCNDKGFDWSDELFAKFLAITIVVMTLCLLFILGLLFCIIITNVKALLIIFGIILCVSLAMKMILSINVPKDEDCKEEISPNDIAKRS